MFLSVKEKKICVKTYKMQNGIKKKTKFKKTKKKLKKKIKKLHNVFGIPGN